MRPVVDILSDVVTAMKPTISATGAVISGGGATVTVGSMSKAVMKCLFVGARIKCTFSGVVVYGTVTTKGTDSFIITLDVSQKVAPTALSIVLNYHHGHLLEIQNKFIEWANNSGVKQEQFPAIICVQDFPEKMDTKKHQRDASLRIIICTDSKQAYDAPARYTYTFEPILYPLFDLFLYKLQGSNEVISYEQGFEKYDRLMWGRVQGEGTASNIFADWIDAIEILNLNCKIINTC